MGETASSGNGSSGCRISSIPTAPSGACTAPENSSNAPGSWTTYAATAQDRSLWKACPGLYALLLDFLRWQPVVPRTAHGLARYLAPLARILRDEVQNALRRPNSSLKTLADEWSGLLFPEGDEGQFADAYAQTLTYALLLARFEGAESLRPLMAADALQREHLLLAEALQLLEANPVREELKMPIDLLERAIGAVDSARIGQGGDPWLYFYEQFLGAYDPNLRKKRGVYYTPVEVVRAQTRLAGELLRTRFDKPLAFADDEVVVLDPAVGTGTLPARSARPCRGVRPWQTRTRRSCRKAARPGRQTARLRDPRRAVLRRTPAPIAKIQGRGRDGQGPRRYI